MSIPIITTNVQAIPEVVWDNYDGLLSDSEDIDALAKNINKLIKDKNLRIKMGNNGKNKLKSNFTFDNFVDGHIKVYNS